ncbi:MAG: nitroreductase family protein [Candidatus Bathyarchaeota archaeon]|nr:nitroreductase family protein [Candidatus Bathyarchaeota archaeon]
MSQIIDALKQRRSIRKYQPRSVPKETLRQILETASYAPSAHNAQPWRFIVLTEAEDKTVLADAMAQVWLVELEKDGSPKKMRWATVNRSIDRFTSAPVLLLACMSMENMDVYSDEKRQRAEHDLAVQSLAAATQNLLLAAHANGLGACWYCAPIFCQDAVRQALGIPDNVEPQALLTLGYPAETPKTPKRLAFENFVFYGKMGLGSGSLSCKKMGLRSGSGYFLFSL